MVGSALAYLIAVAVQGGLGSRALVPSAWLAAAALLSMLGWPLLATYALIGAIGAAAGAYALDWAAQPTQPSTVDPLTGAA
jgi:hypothetical protein